MSVDDVLNLRTHPLIRHNSHIDLKNFGAKNNLRPITLNHLLYCPKSFCTTIINSYLPILTAIKMSNTEDFAADLVILCAKLFKKIKIFEADIESLMGKYDEIAEAKEEIMDLKDELMKKDREIEDLERLVRDYRRREDSESPTPTVIIVYEMGNGNNNQ